VATVRSASPERIAAAASAMALPAALVRSVPKALFAGDVEAKLAAFERDVQRELVMQALLDVRRKKQVELPEAPGFAIERTRQKDHGDFATNAALVLCKPLGMAFPFGQFLRQLLNLPPRFLTICGAVASLVV
jgi:hypothetical protein